jgi:peptidyl-prolyl cis-trans isomerase C
MVLSILALGALAPGAEPVAAIVNGEEITLAEVDAAIDGGQPSLMPLTAAQKRQARSEALTLLIDDRLVRQYVKDRGPEIPKEDIDKQWAAFEKSLGEQKKTVAEYLKDTKQTEAQIKNNFKMMMQLAKIIDRNIDDEKLKQYFEVNRDFFERTTVQVSHIVVRYNNNASADDKERAKKKLTQVRKSVIEGQTTFAAAAKDHSECPSASKGGEIGYIARKWQVDDRFAQVAFALAKDAVSDVFESDSGAHILKVTDRKAGKTITFEDAKLDVRDCYETELRQQLLINLRAKAKIEVKLK